MEERKKPKFCPFFSIADSQGHIYAECKRESCGIWNEGRKACGLRLVPK